MSSNENVRKGIEALLRDLDSGEVAVLVCFAVDRDDRVAAVVSLPIKGSKSYVRDKCRRIRQAYDQFVERIIEQSDEAPS